MEDIFKKFLGLIKDTLESDHVADLMLEVEKSLIHIRDEHKDKWLVAKRALIELLNKDMDMSKLDVELVKLLAKADEQKLSKKKHVKK